MLHFAIKQYFIGFPYLSSAWPWVVAVVRWLHAQYLVVRSIDPVIWHHALIVSGVHFVKETVIPDEQLIVHVVLLWFLFISSLVSLYLLVHLLHYLHALVQLLVLAIILHRLVHDQPFCLLYQPWVWIARCISNQLTSTLGAAPLSQRGSDWVPWSVLLHCAFILERTVFSLTHRGVVLDRFSEIIVWFLPLHVEWRLIHCLAWTNGRVVLDRRRWGSELRDMSCEIFIVPYLTSRWVLVVLIESAFIVLLFQLVVC